MKVFVSWSGDTSKSVAEIFREWLPVLIHDVDVFVSSQDIGGGTRALDVLADELEATSYGLILTTRATQSSPWINFEAGALAKHVAKSRVVPVLVDLGVSDLKNPLAQFQAIDSRHSGAVLKLVREMNQQTSPRHVDDGVLQKDSTRFGPSLTRTCVRFERKWKEVRAAMHLPNLRCLPKFVWRFGGSRRQFHIFRRASTR